MAEVNRGRGVQVGDQNTQTNVFMPSQSQPLNLGALNWHVAATKVRELSRDNAVVALAAVPLADAVGILAIVLGEAEGVAVSLLAHMNPARCRELVTALKRQRPWLEQLPAAAAEIAGLERKALGSLGERTGQVEHIGPSTEGTHGYRQPHRNGQILWSPRRGALEVQAPHLYDGTSGVLRFPLGSPEPAPRSAQGTEGTFQRFEGGAAVYRTEMYGVRAIFGFIGAYYRESGGPAGPLGYPAGAAERIGPSRHGKRAGWSKRFEGGTVYRVPRETEGYDSVSVSSEIADYHHAQGGVAGRLGFPTREAVRVTSSFGTEAVGQTFEGATVFVSRHGTFMVRDAVGTLNVRLGLPSSEENDGRQDFEGGAIFSSADGEFSVRKGILEPARRLGFPTTAEQRLGENADDFAQFFEKGVITVRDGVVRSWVSALEEPWP
ncbi:LGFP repeat-containing protein [Actinoplanes sp. CA-142083]|uniref:LGFP repeat-containing protein n=1 Tax=Actinoplanes sp. CA-142083 TaxID=3239903 RepID=UPI003D8C3F86